MKLKYPGQSFPCPQRSLNIFSFICWRGKQAQTFTQCKFTLKFSSQKWNSITKFISCCSPLLGNIPLYAVIWPEHWGKPSLFKQWLLSLDIRNSPSRKLMAWTFQSLFESHSHKLLAMQSWVGYTPLNISGFLSAKRQLLHKCVRRRNSDNRDGDVQCLLSAP